MSKNIENPLKTFESVFNSTPEFQSLSPDYDIDTALENLHCIASSAALIEETFKNASLAKLADRLEELVYNKPYPDVRCNVCGKQMVGDYNIKVIGPHLHCSCAFEHEDGYNIDCTIDEWINLILAEERRLMVLCAFAIFLIERSSICSSKIFNLQSMRHWTSLMMLRRHCLDAIYNPSLNVLIFAKDRIEDDLKRLIGPTRKMIQQLGRQDHRVESLPKPCCPQCLEPSNWFEGPFTRYKTDNDKLIISVNIDCNCNNGHKWKVNSATRYIKIQKEHMECSCRTEPEITWQKDDDDLSLIVESYCATCGMNDEFQVAGLNALLEPILFCENEYCETNCFEFVTINNVTAPIFFLLRSIIPSVDGLNFTVEPPLHWLHGS